jgi:hypothetical protein
MKNTENKTERDIQRYTKQGEHVHFESALAISRHANTLANNAGREDEVLENSVVDSSEGA